MIANRVGSARPKPWQIHVGPLTPAAQGEVVHLAAQAQRNDAAAPLSETPLLRIGDDQPWLTHISARSRDDANRLLGYAQIDRSGVTASGELVVAPDHRRQGIGSTLLRMAEADARLPAIAGAGNSPGQQLRIWAHGDIPAAQAFAAAKGYAPVRELLLLSRPLAAAENSFELPDGYAIRAFQPGTDDAAWVNLNAQVFADHPEQGRLTRADLQTRMAESWFDASGFHIVTDPAGEMIGFCWTKAAANETPAALAPGTAGEIYAIGVALSHRRLGLAGGLLHAAYDHMLAAGLTHVTLYVEGDNEAALAAYYSHGFTPLTADVQYAASPTSALGVP